MDKFLIIASWQLGGETLWALESEYNDLNTALRERDNRRNENRTEGYSCEVYKKVTAEDY